VPVGGASIGVGLDSFGKRPPFGVPGSLVAVGDPACRASDLADVGSTVWGVTKGPERFEREGLVFEIARAEEAGLIETVDVMAGGCQL
jgi:hypothetical protein